jgi:hypothetical protein
MTIQYSERAIAIYNPGDVGGPLLVAASEWPGRKPASLNMPTYHANIIARCNY